MAGAPYIVWSPDGETPPKVSHKTHKEAHSAAWMMAARFPGRRFFVMARSGKGALAEQVSAEAESASEPDKWADTERLRPMRLVTIEPTENDVCDRCGEAPVRDVLDGDYLCQSCCEDWARGEQPEDDLVPLSHPVMREALADWNAKYGRASDAELQMISAGHRRFERLERRHSKRSGR